MKKKAIFLFALLLCCCSQTPQAGNWSSQTAEERVAKLTKIKEAVVPFFKPMKIQDGDWLQFYPEKGQTFEEYINGKPTLPTEKRKIIYIQPIGNFTAKQREILRLTAEYMKAFYKLPVTLGAEKKLENVPHVMKRTNPFEGQWQIRTDYFLEKLLPEMLPEDAAAFICFTNFDLFPDDVLNYVFGQANIKTRVGVWSLWRFGDPEKSPEDYRKFLSRTLKVAMHETGHMFSITHCTKYVCLMSGSNHLGETDRKPLDVCPECMAKIAWAMNYEPSERYQNLSKFWENQGWTDEQKSFDEKAATVRGVSP